MWFFIKKQLNKREFPLHKNALCQVWLKLDRLNWRKKSLNVTNAILVFHYNLPLEMDLSLLVNKLDILSKKDVVESGEEVRVFLLFCYYPNWERTWPLIWTSFIPKKLSKLCGCSAEASKLSWLLNSSIYEFYNVAMISPRRSSWPFTWISLTTQGCLSFVPTFVEVKREV